MEKYYFFVHVVFPALSGLEYCRVSLWTHAWKQRHPPPVSVTRVKQQLRSLHASHLTKHPGGSRLWLSPSQPVFHLLPPLNVEKLNSLVFSPLCPFTGKEKLSPQGRAARVPPSLEGARQGNSGHSSVGQRSVSWEAPHWRNAMALFALFRLVLSAPAPLSAPIPQCPLSLRRNAPLAPAASRRPPSRLLTAGLQAGGSAR